MKQYGRWTIIGTQYTNIDKNKYVRCRCSCGTERDVYYYSLTSGKSRSCGCLSAELAGDRARVHGETHTKFYCVWNANKPTKTYSEFKKLYLTSYIKHCEEYTEKNTLFNPDRKTWQTKAEKQRTRSDNIWITHKGETLCATDWSIRTGIPRETLDSRLAAGWSVDKILTK